MGQTGRGEDAEITTYLSQTLVSELQGNIIDLCPVGALTSKPYSFTARPWELKKTETIDVMDALGSNILVDTKGREVMRILPRNHDAVNEEWLSDKSRFVWDGLRRQRLDKPYVRVNGKLAPATWGEAFTAIKTALDGKRIAGLIGDLVSTEAAFALQQLIGSLGGQVECRVDGSKLPLGNRSAYVGTATIEDIDSAEIIQLIGTNPRTEAPVLNARLRKAWINGANISLLGEVVDLTYEYSHIGTDKVDLDALFSKDFDDVKDKNSLVIVGQGALQGADGAVVLAAAMELAKKTGSKFMVLHTAAGRVGAMDLGCVSDGDVDTLVSSVDVVFNLGSDEDRIELERRIILELGRLLDSEREQLIALKPVGSVKQIVAGAHLFDLNDDPIRENDGGYITSVGFSPTFGHFIGLGFFKGGQARLGEQIKMVDHLRGIETECEIINTVSFDPKGDKLRD